ncbi:hypothetical protein K525DRAFT_248200 [Schizophyllum commune Loenen D]|nr:hypothetical protein K525DRAFT_248200 [Schizophyllum commune Loenen D]
MFQSYLAAVLAVSAASVVRADVTPTDPGPGSSFTAGKECTFNWDPDTDSAGAWKSFTVELMSGGNQAMNHITTVATDLDGTQKGTHSWTCPELEPYSAIYFYQFSSCDSENKTWTTRFTITSPSGETTDPEHATQDDGSAIPWGTGKLVDEASAVALPSCDGNAGNATTPASGAASGAASATDSGAASSAAASGAASSTGGAAASSGGVSPAEAQAATNTALNAATSGAATGTADAAASTQSNDALPIQARAWQAAGALGASALAFTFML